MVAGHGNTSRHVNTVTNLAKVMVFPQAPTRPSLLRGIDSWPSIEILYDPSTTSRRGTTRIPDRGSLLKRSGVVAR